ncbi:MAG: glutathione binding-like protein [Bdellovibrionota bacterium]
MSESELQLYSLATPNGQKVSVALEEMGLDYDAHLIDISKGDQFTESFVAINPNSKIPALVDPVGNHGKPLAIMESGAILMYLAEKTGTFLPQDVALRSKTLQWLFFQVGGVGPMFGQFGHFFKYAADQCDHPYPTQRYTKEVKRLLGVLNKQLEDQSFLVGKEITIADFATAPWVVCLDKFYGGKEILELSSFTHVQRWVQAFMDRPAVQKGMSVCARSINT